MTMKPDSPPQRKHVDFRRRPENNLFRRRPGQSRFCRRWVQNENGALVRAPTFHGRILVHPGLNWSQRQNLRLFLLHRDGRCCAICSRVLTETRGLQNSITIDHIVPRKAGGSNDALNLQLACKKCNLGRHFDPRGDHFVCIDLTKSATSVVVISDTEAAGCNYSNQYGGCRFPRN